MPYPRILIVGYGNPLRGDDGFGPRVAGEIAALHLPDVEVLIRHQLTPELAEPLSRAALAIFIDAAAGAQECGADLSSPQGRDSSRPSPNNVAQSRLTCCPVEVGAGRPGAFTHRADPGGLLWLARELYGACPEAWTVSAAAADFELGARLSPDVEAAVAAAVAMILDRVSAANA
jgi:Ni,Fe-hydrogenase maturation factor